MMYGSFRLNDGVHNIVVSAPVVNNSFNMLAFIFLLVFLIGGVIAGFSTSYFNRRSDFAFVASAVGTILFAVASFNAFIITMATSFGGDSDKTLDNFVAQVHESTGYSVLSLGDDVTSNFLGETTTSIGKTYGDAKLVRGKDVVNCAMQNVTLSRDSKNVRYLFNCSGK